MMRGSSGAQPELTVGGVQAAYEVAANPEAFAERLLRLAGAVKEADKAKADARAEQAAAREAIAAVKAGNARIAEMERAIGARDSDIADRESALAQDRARFEAEHKAKSDDLGKAMTALEARSAALAERENALSAETQRAGAQATAAAAEDVRLAALAAELDTQQKHVAGARDAVLAWLTNIRSDLSDALDDMPDPESLGFSGESEEGMAERIAKSDVPHETSASPKSKKK